MQQEKSSIEDADTQASTPLRLQSTGACGRCERLAWLAYDLRTIVLILAIVALLAMMWASWLFRFSERTAGGRYYRTDRWTFKTIVVEKDGYTHTLQNTNNRPIKK